MIAASPGPTMIAAMVSRARRRIVNHFYALHAISAEDSVAFVPQSRSERAQFERMQASGVVHQTSPGQYWLDAAAYQAEVDARRQLLVPIVIIICLLIAGLITLGYRS